MARSVIPGFLERVRALVYRREAWRSALYAIAALGALAIALPLIGSLLGHTRAAALAVLGIGGLAAVLVVVFASVLGGVVPRRRFERDTELARWIGARRGDIASDLLSTVELAAAPERPGAPSPALVDALITSTAQAIEAIEPETLLPARELAPARRWALGAIASNALLVALVPHAVASGWRTLVSSPAAPFDGAQLSAVPLVGDLDATLQFPAYTKRQPLPLRSSSGDVRGLPGTIVTLRAHMLVPAASAELVFDDTASPSGAAAVRGRAPAVEPPAGGSEAEHTVVAKLDGDIVTASFTIDHAARYRFAITSPGGARSIEATPRTVDAEADQAPTVQLLAPADTLDVSNLKRIELAYVIEDDFGLTSAELVWDAGKDHGRKPITLAPSGAEPSSRAQGKLTWDIAELAVPSGGDVRYWLEAKDNDSIGGPNVGKSREFHLRVISPRERHEETLSRQQALAALLLHNLGARLVGPGDDAVARDELSRELHEAVKELASISGAYDKDRHASDALRKALAQIRERLDKLASSEQKLLPKGAKTSPTGRFTMFDKTLVAELEDDTIALADWLDRELLEGMLDISDEIAAHQKRLADLLAQYAKTKDPRVMEEIEREMRAIDKGLAELQQHKRGMPEDVLDQYVNRDAMQAQQGANCMDEVAKLIHAGKTTEAQQKLDQCKQQQEHGASAQEDGLSKLRSDKFSEEQKKLDEVMNELADASKDQDDIAAEANRLFEQYAEKADEVARGNRREASKKVGALVDKLRRRIKDINEQGLTPFAKEELDIVERRLDDVDKMVGDGDLAEAAGMAHQAKQSLDAIGGELEAALNDDPKSKWAQATQEALDGVEKTRPAAKELIDELSALSPKPDQIMSGDDQRGLERLRRRQEMNRDRTRKLAERTKQLGGELPGDAAAELEKKLGTAVDQMGQAVDQMKAKDPSGTRESTRSAAETLEKARERARSAARQAQESVTNDEPIRIPGADEYKTPEKFREELQQGMSKKTDKVDPYDDMINRYVQDLNR